MSQISLDLAPSDGAMPRRIDITIERLAKLFDELTPGQQAELAGRLWPTWSVVVIVQRLRAMERGEEAAGLKTTATVADAYDRVVQPGEPLLEAMLRTFRVAFGDSAGCS